MNATKTRRLLSQLKRGIRRYPLIVFAFLLGLAMVLASQSFAAKVRTSTTTSSSGFDITRVLPQPLMPQPPSQTVYNADSIKQYDGKDGHKCYAAVNGVVYEIPQTGQWQSGQHSPSNGEAYCGADLTQAMKHAPHGESKLQELAKVGIFK